MAAIRYPRFLKLEILTASSIWRANVRHRAKFCADRPNHHADIAIFRFSEMAAICHYGFLKV